MAADDPTLATLLDPPAWLCATCGCGRSVWLPGAMLARQYGPETPIGAVAARLRCRTCGDVAAEVRVSEDPAGVRDRAAPYPRPLGQK